MTEAKGEESTKQPVLHRHVKRPEWGLAIITWERDGKRAFQFEDGRARIIKRGFYQLMQPVDPPLDRTERALARCDRARGRNEAVRRADQISLAAQIAYFKEQYPQGFRGEAWSGKMRGEGAKRALKRHRDRAVAHARAELTADALDRLLATEQYELVLQTLIRVLEKTSLVSAAKVKILRTLPYTRQRAVALALRELLFGEGSVAERINQYVGALEVKSWELVTAPLALLCPEEHVCVRPSVFKQQALWMAPRLSHPVRPEGRVYARYRAMSLEVKSKLEEAGLQPRDLLDVHDFIGETLRPAVRETLVERTKTQRASRPVPPALAAETPAAAETQAAETQAA